MREDLGWSRERKDKKKTQIKTTAVTVEVLWSKGRLSGKQALPRTQIFIQQGSTDGSCQSVICTVGWLPAEKAAVWFSSLCLWHRPSSELTGEGCAHRHAVLLHHSCIPSHSVFFSLVQSSALYWTRAHKIVPKPAFNHICLISAFATKLKGRSNCCAF